LGLLDSYVTDKVLTETVASALEDAWKRLKLTGDEEEAVTFDEETPAEKLEETKPYFWGKLLTNKQFNARTMKMILKNIWKPHKGVVIKDLDSNLFSFQFFFVVDRDYVLSEVAWSFDGAILLLKQITWSEQPADITFDSARFWVKAYNIPAKQQTHAFT